MEVPGYVGCHRPKLKIAGELRDYLLRDETLKQWAHLTIRQRCNMLTHGEVEPQYQIKMPETTLRDFYRREGIKW